MKPEILLLMPFVIPVIAALLGVVTLARKAALFAFLSFVAVVLSAVAWIMIAGGPPVSFSHPWFAGFNLLFSLTPLKSVMLAFALGFQIMTTLYIQGYHSRIARPALFTFFILLAFGASCAVILTDSLLVLLVAWEIFLVALYAVIHSGGEKAEAASMKALVIGGAGDFLMILGLLLYFYLSPGSEEIGAAIPVGSSKTAFASFFLLFLGAGAKAGMFPFHTWIPDAALTMPAPGFAAIPGSLEKVVGVWFLFLITGRMFELNGPARTVMYVFAILTVLAVIVPALTERNLKKVLALTAIAQVGYMVAGMATSLAAGLAGALMLMLAHASYKSAMFFAAGSLEEKAGSADLDQVEGIGRSMPFTAAGFLLAFVAAAGLPPTGAFIGKDLIFHGLVERGQVVVLLFLVFGAVLNVAVFCKILAVVIARKDDAAKTEASMAQAMPVLLLGLTAVGSSYIFMKLAPVFGEATGAGPSRDWIMAVWHVSPAMAVSYGVYLLGFLLYFLARERSEKASAMFSSLRDSPVVGRALAMAGEKKFDGYEIGLKVVGFIARIVFQYFDRMIDRVVWGVITIGAAITRPALSGIHTGTYGHYLAWLIVGLVLVTALLLRRVIGAE